MECIKCKKKSQTARPTAAGAAKTGSASKPDTRERARKRLPAWEDVDCSVD